MLPARASETKLHTCVIIYEVRYVALEGRGGCPVSCVLGFSLVSCGALRDGDFVVILAPGRILFFCNDFHSPHRDELNDCLSDFRSSGSSTSRRNTRAAQVGGSPPTLAISGLCAVGIAMLASRSYWNERYAADPLPFDSLQQFSSCVPYREALLRVLPDKEKGPKLLIVGAGTSRLPEELAAEGFEVQTIDFSETSVDILNKRHKAAHLSIKNQIMDVTAMGFAEGSFDVVLDKATLDSVCCQDEELDAESTSAGRMIDEVARVLKPGGRYVVLSIAPPDQRLGLLRRSGGVPAQAQHAPGDPAHVPTRQAQRRLSTDALSLWSALDMCAIDSSGAGADSHFLYTLTRAS